VARTGHTAMRSATQHVPILDRSRSRLRLPIEILPEALRQASGEGLASPVATVRLETGGVITDGQLHPAAEAMLQVIASASMMVAVDVQREGDSSITTIWATPSRAVVTSTLDPDLVDIEPVRLARLPETLSDVILLSRPETMHERPITVSTLVMARADEARSSPDHGRSSLSDAGIAAEDVELLVAFQAPTTRRWRISSTWASDGGQRMAELRGLDAGPHGQWLIEMTGHKNQPGEMTFTPQGDGDILRALREVLPRYWVGTALNPRRTG